MIADQQVVGEKVAEAAERGRASKLMPILLAKQGQYGGFQQGIGRQVSARMQGARHGRVAAHRAHQARAPLSLAPNMCSTFVTAS